MWKLLISALISAILLNVSLPAQARQGGVGVGVSLHIVDACGVQGGSDGDVKIKCRSSLLTAGTSPSNSRISPAKVSQHWCRGDDLQAAGDADAPVCSSSPAPGFDRQLVMVTF